MKNYRFDPSRTISGSLSIILIVALSVWVAWIVVKKANEIIAISKDYTLFNIQKRINNQ